jgi:hypothetical protein
MTPGIRYALIGTALLGVAAVPMRAPAEADAVPALEGMYRSQGTNPDGTEYRGFVQVNRRGDSFIVSWLQAEAADNAVRIARVSIGVGIVNDNMLAVSYPVGRSSGVVMYKIEGEGQRLVGRWAVLGDNGRVYEETLVKLPPDAQAPPEAQPNDQAPPVRPAPRQQPGTLSL